ncbi:MAG: hypothetical protein WAL50_15895 [Kineosporiaceae bacterium]
MAGEIFHDPASGRPYRVNPVTGRTEWVDDAPAQPFQAAPHPQPVHPTQDEPRGTEKRGAPKWLWGLGGLVLGLLLGAGLAGGEDDTTTTAATAGGNPTGSKTAASPPAAKSLQPAKSEPQRTQADEEQVLVIKDARTLGDAFDANQVAAEKYWNGKRVQLTAEIQNITKGRVAFTGVTTDKFSLTQVVCKLSEPEQALTVKNGAKSTAVGTVDGQFMGVIELKDCVLK